MLGFFPRKRGREGEVKVYRCESQCIDVPWREHRAVSSRAACVHKRPTGGVRHPDWHQRVNTRPRYGSHWSLQLVTEARAGRAVPTRGYDAASMSLEFCLVGEGEWNCAAPHATVSCCALSCPSISCWSSSSSSSGGGSYRQQAGAEVFTGALWKERMEGEHLSTFQIKPRWLSNRRKNNNVTLWGIGSRRPTVYVNYLHTWLELNSQKSLWATSRDIKHLSSPLKYFCIFAYFFT